MLPSSYNTGLIIFTIIALVIFIVLFKIQAPYGRHSRPGWGPGVPGRYAWIIMEAPAALIPFVLYLVYAGGKYIPLIFLGVWEIHYIHRSFIYPFLIKSSKDMPLSIMMSGFVFNCCNGIFQCMWLFVYGEYSAVWFHSPQFIFGCAVFGVGLVINIHSDHITRSLRKSPEDGYSIPFGGMFRFVSAPNYLGEIVEWAGWAILTFSVTGLIFFIWTIANLAPRALSNHRWYKEKFPDYPRNRKALLPWIW